MIYIALQFAAAGFLLASDALLEKNACLGIIVFDRVYCFGIKSAS